MRFMASWFMRLLAVSVMVAMWLVAPYMLHTQSHLLNVLELLAWAFGLLMVTLLAVGSFALGKPILKPNPPQRMPIPAPGIMQPKCEACATTPAQVYSMTKNALLCVKCATATPGAFGTLYDVAYGVHARMTKAGEAALVNIPQVK